MFKESLQSGTCLGGSLEHQPDLTLRTKQFKPAAGPGFPERKTPSVSLGALILRAQDHMNMHGPTVSRTTAVSQVLQTHATTDGIDQDTVIQRRQAGVPSFVDPERLYKKMRRQTLLPLHSVQVIDDAREAASQRGNPLTEYYDAAKTIILKEWRMKDSKQAEQAKANAALQQMRDNCDNAVVEHQVELHLDQPTPFLTVSVVYKATT